MPRRSPFTAYRSPFYDVVVIGGGAAGLSAALWCDELGLSTLVLESASEIGGQLLWVYNRIENHLGAESAADGRELRDRFAAQIKQRGFELKTNVQIQSINFADKTIKLAGDEEIKARFLILATGVARRKLNVPGENEFKGRGIIESGKRDGGLVTGKKVCVIGGGDAACENALILGAVAEQVYLVHRRREFRARREFLDAIASQPNITPLTETEVLRILGKESVTGVELENKDGAILQIEVNAVLIRIGVEPNTALFRQEFKTDANGYLEVNNLCETSVLNVFAVGDIANPLSPTVSTAVGTGATAAKVVSTRFNAQKSS